jgi:hypothetical protein
MTKRIIDGMSAEQITKGWADDPQDLLEYLEDLCNPEPETPEVEKLQAKIEKAESDRVRLLEAWGRDLGSRTPEPETPEEKKERSRNEIIGGWFFFGLLLIIILA